MPNDIPLRCQCGAVRGQLTDHRIERATRVTCLCDDCQAFARWLGRPDVLDARGGSDILQVAPATLRYDSGGDLLRCMQLGPKGPHRGYTACCRQPAGNTLARTRSPFAGVVTGMIEVPAGSSLDALIGPSRGGVHGRFALGGCPPRGGCEGLAGPHLAGRPPGAAELARRSVAAVAVRDRRGRPAINIAGDHTRRAGGPLRVTPVQSPHQVTERSPARRASTLRGSAQSPPTS